MAHEIAHFSCCSSPLPTSCPPTLLVFWSFFLQVSFFHFMFVVGILLCIQVELHVQQFSNYFFRPSISSCYECNFSKFVLALM